MPRAVNDVDHSRATYWNSAGGLKTWIADRRWRAVPGGWTVTGELQGWHFQIDIVADGLRISASAPGDGDPAVWVVTG